MLVYKSKWVTDNLSSPEYNISRHSNPISMHTKKQFKYECSLQTLT